MIEKIITGDLGVNTYLYNYTSNKTAIIDPGSDFNNIVSLIESRNFKPTTILLTHGHFDHIGAVKTLKDRYNIPVYIHEDDATYLGDGSKDRHLEMFKSMGSNGDHYFNNYYIESDNVDFKVKDGELLIDLGIKVIHTPGHSLGSSCFYSETDSIIFTGDTMFKNGMGRTDFAGGDYNQLIESLKILLKLPKKTKVYPGHGPMSTIRDES